MTFAIQYTNSEGATGTFGTIAPFIVNLRKGFGGLSNDITSVKQAGQHGETFVNQRYEIRALEWSGEIVASSKQELNGYRLQIASLFNSDLAGTLVYLVDDKEYEIDVLPEVVPLLDYEEGNTTMQYDISVKALQPFWRDLSQYADSIALAQQSGKWIFPTKITSTFVFAEMTTGTTVTIDNTGDLQTGAIFTITCIGTVTNPKILNIMTQEYFGFSGTFTGGTLFTIDTRTGSKKVTMTLNGVTTNAMPLRLVGSTFLAFAKGNNYLQLQASSGGSSLMGNVSFAPLVLGV